MQSNEHRPPYVTFERRQQEDRAASLAANHYVSVDVDYIIIVPHGSEGKTRVERVYTEWLEYVKPQVGPRGPSNDLGTYESNSRFDPDWVTKIQTMYDMWRKGEYMEVEGTPLKNWPVISPSFLRLCTDQHVLTVEQLANATDELAQGFGMGGIQLRQRARDYLAALGSDTSKLASRLEAAEAEVKNKDARIAALEEQQRALDARLQALTLQQKKAA